MNFYYSYIYVIFHQRNFRYPSSGSLTFQAIFANSRLNEYIAAISFRLSELSVLESQTFRDQIFKIAQPVGTNQFGDAPSLINFQLIESRRA